MLIVLDQNYRPIATSDMTITQGDAALGRLLVVAPPAVGIAASFQLPDETITQKYPLFMNPAKVPDEVDYYVYSLNVKSDVFSGVSGKLLIQLWISIPYADPNQEFTSITGAAETAQEFSVDPIEMNVLRGAVTIPQVGKDIPSDETWTALLNGIATLNSVVSDISKHSVKAISGVENMWTLGTGYYKLIVGGLIRLKFLSTTDALWDKNEDMLVWVDNKTGDNATFIAMNAPSRDSTGGMPSNPTFIYGYSYNNGSAYSRKTFELKTYAEPYKPGYGISIVDQTISVSLPVAETQSV